MTTHEYATGLVWTGQTISYDSYDRQHEVVMGSSSITLSADVMFRGDAALPNPEKLVVAAASSCQLLSFLAVAALGGVEVRDYRDDAVGLMDDTVRPIRLTSILLRPKITVAGTARERVERLVQKAHQQCYIANSLSTPVALDPVIEVV